MNTQRYINIVESHTGVGVEQLKRLLDLFLVGSTAHVEEVGRVATLELDDVHGGHRQTGAVNCRAEIGYFVLYYIALYSYSTMYIIRMYGYMYVCMVITFSKGKDQPGMVANPARGQLNRENEYFSVPNNIILYYFTLYYVLRSNFLQYNSTAHKRAIHLTTVLITRHWMNTVERQNKTQTLL